MGKVELFCIMFDNPMGTYYAGQTVTGKVILKLNEEIALKGIFIHLQGKAEVSWNETVSHYNPTTKSTEARHVTRSDTQTYFNLKYPLQGTELVNKLGPGEFHYPFSIGLPLNLPSSIEGKFGYIRYTCSSNISRPWRFDPKCKAAITVLEIVDLNTIPGAGSTISFQNSKRTGCCCFDSGPLSAVVALNKQAYVPGENIYIQADIDNSSDESITHTTATLYCWITYKAGHHTKRETKTISSIERGLIAPHSHEQWSNQPLRIPALPPTRLGGMCRIINIEYFLQFTLDPSGTCTSDLDFTFPVTIGTIPLRTDFNTFLRPQTMPVVSAPPLVDFGQAAYHAPTAPALEMPTFNEYPDLPPPSYEECVYGKVNIREDDDEHISEELNFAPRYMYYNQTQPPAYH